MIFTINNASINITNHYLVYNIKYLNKNSYYYYCIKNNIFLIFYHQTNYLIGTSSLLKTGFPSFYHPLIPSFKLNIFLILFYSSKVTNLPLLTPP